MSEIKKFYAGKNVLITGGTGFLGKVLVEKLLYTCGDLNTIYLIVRSKKGKSFEERKKSFINNIVFDRIRKSEPHILSKIKIINGDMKLKTLGLSDDDYNEIINNVNVVIHNAAVVRFDMSLRVAVQSNLLATIELLEIAKRITNLEVFVYISTAFSQGKQNYTEEIAYPSVMDPYDVIKICHKFDEDTLFLLEPKLIEGFQNTYVFTKSLSEDVVYRHREHFPITIVRPCLINPSHDDPMPGYIEGLHGLGAFSLGIGRGVIRSVYGFSDVKVPTAPADYVANGIIASSMLQAISDKLEITYYNIAPPLANCWSFQQEANYINLNRYKFSFNYALWHPNYSITSCYFIHFINVLIFQILPAMFIDALLLLFGKRPLLMRIQRQIKNAFDMVDKFNSTQFNFIENNFNRIQHRLNKIDKNIFKTDLRNLDLNEYYPRRVWGVKMYMLNETREEYPFAYKVAITLNVIDKVTKTFVIYHILKYIVPKIYDYIF